jgi:1-acyl-sn-glycerol-3-phosphate acyltransferase
MNKFVLYCLNIYVYTLFLLFSAIGIPVLTFSVAALSLFISHRSTMKRFRRAISWYGRLVTSIPFPFIKLCYEDLSNGETEGPYIFVSNHRSSTDAFLMCLLPHECVQIVNTWPFHIPILGFYARLSGYLNIKRMASDEFFEKAVRLLNEQVSIIFFPEGTRSGGKQMGNFHGSAFRLALMSKVPIVPLCISGNENIPPRGSALMRPGTIRVRRLPAITWNEYKDLNAFSLKNKVREIISRELQLMESGHTIECGTAPEGMNN